jgi:hypothetical protein
MTRATHEHDHDNRDDHDNHANDNDAHERSEKILGAIAPASKGSMLASASLTALEAVFNSVDTASVIGRSTMPLLQFKRDGNGTWAFGQKRTVVEDDSRWAANPRSFKWGYVYFDNNNKPHERMVPISQPMPDATTLPDTGFEWQEQWTVNMKCTSGADAGTEVVYKANTVGGIQAVAGLIDAVRNRFNSGQHNGEVAPIVQLQKDSYQHGQYGRVWTPQLNIVDWISLDGPAPAPADGGGRQPPREPPTTTPPAEQPRRRRVA